MSERIVVISDLQVPYQDQRAVDAVARFIKAYRPTSVICVGDEIDAPQISRWNKGMAGEFTRDLGRDRDDTVRVLEQLKVQHISRSNHTGRLLNYVQKYAPGLSGLPELSIEGFLRLDELGIRYHHQPYEFVPGWLLMHGDEGGLSQEPGKTALNLAKKAGRSVVCGHTHRLGLQPFTESVNGKVTGTRWGMEVGHLMDLRKASYLMTGGANWQRGFGLLKVDGRNVTPQLIPIHKDGTFTVDGRVWK